MEGVSPEHDHNLLPSNPEVQTYNNLIKFLFDNELDTDKLRLFIDSKKWNEYENLILNWWKDKTNEDKPFFQEFYRHIA